MNSLNTDHPIALQNFMSEAVFDVGFSEMSVEKGVVSNDAAEGTGVVSTNNNVADETPVAWNSWGNNRKNILFLTANDDFDYFSKDAEVAFIKTLKALKLEIDDITVLNSARIPEGVSFDLVKKAFLPAHCIFLGVDPQEMGVEAMAENILKIDDGIQYLYSYSFEDMLLDAQKKRVFWETIKLVEF